MSDLLHTLTSAQQRTLLLLQHALWKKEVPPEEFVEMSAADWQQIMDFAANQGIYAMVYDGLASLPKNLWPPKNLVLQWHLGVESIEKRYAQQKMALQSLSRLYQVHNIACLLLKGVGLAPFYPVPEHRESGDLDIFLMGNYAEGNEVIRSKGISVDSSSHDVHAEFHYMGVPVENHLTLLEVSRLKVDQEMEPFLQQLLWEKGATPTHAEAVNLPSLTFNHLYLLKHTLKHFLTTGIVLRHILDWAFVVNECNQLGVYEVCMEHARKFGMDRYSGIFNSLAVNLIGFSFDTRVSLERDPAILNQVVREVVHYQDPYSQTPGRNLFRLLARKGIGLRRLYRSRWKFQLVGKDAFGKELTSRIFHYFPGLRKLSV